MISPPPLAIIGIFFGGEHWDFVLWQLHFYINTIINKAVLPFPPPPFILFQTTFYYSRLRGHHPAHTKTTHIEHIV